jgi:dCMP deaminase
MTTEEKQKKWDERFLRLAREVATWSKDPSTKVGAVIVRSNRTVASLGYNGFARGVLDNSERYEKRELKYEMIVHAEENALLNSPERMDGYTLYVTPLPPCCRCAGSIIQHGIKRVVIERRKLSPDWEKSFEVAKTMFEEAGIKVDIVPVETIAVAAQSSIVLPPKTAPGEEGRLA